MYENVYQAVTWIFSAWKCSCARLFRYPPNSPDLVVRVWHLSHFLGPCGRTFQELSLSWFVVCGLSSYCRDADPDPQASALESLTPGRIIHTRWNFRPISKRLTRIRQLPVNALICWNSTVNRPHLGSIMYTNTRTGQKHKDW